MIGRSGVIGEYFDCYSMYCLMKGDDIEKRPLEKCCKMLKTVYDGTDQNLMI